MPLTPNVRKWGTEVIPSFRESLKKLQMDYVDLLLLHFPVTECRDMSWRRLEEIYKAGEAKAIGVSNYTVKHLQQMKAKFTVTPAVNQVEMSIALQQPELVEYCRKEGIIVEAYTPLAEGVFLKNPIIEQIAKKYDKTTAQVMLRWCIDYGVVVLTKSSNKERIKENFDIFDFKLDNSDMSKLRTLDSGFRTNWDPTYIA